MRQIIQHFTDTDLYKLSMCVAVLDNYPRAMVQYEFKDRNNTIYPKGFADLVNEQIKMMENVVVTDEEIDFMKRKLYYIPHWFYTYLKGYRYDSKEVTATQDEEGHLSIHIEGYWHRTILWEVQILSIVSELKNIVDGNLEKIDYQREYDKAYHKAIKLMQNDCVFSEFGTRRRSSFELQDAVVHAFSDAMKKFKTAEIKGLCVGTSNVYLAMKYDMTPNGTMAHELIAAIGGMYDPQMANYIAMDIWQKTYVGALGTFLYDTFSWKPFAMNFNEHFARCFAGLRVDSGDNIEQMHKICEKYASLGVNPKEKQIIFSNALDTDEAIKINKIAKDYCKPAFGIGTHFTADVSEYDIKPSNIVIKLLKVKITEKNEWSDTCKMSEDIGKYTGNKETVDIFKKLLHLN